MWLDLIETIGIEESEEADIKYVTKYSINTKQWLASEWIGVTCIS